MGALGAFLGPSRLIAVLLGTILVAGLMAVVLVIWKKRVGRTPCAISDTCWLRCLRLHLPGPEVSLDNPESLKVPFGVAVAVAVVLYTVRQVWGACMKRSTYQKIKSLSEAPQGNLRRGDRRGGRHSAFAVHAAVWDHVVCAGIQYLYDREPGGARRSAGGSGSQLRDLRKRYSIRGQCIRDNVCDPILIASHLDPGPGAEFQLAARRDPESCVVHYRSLERWSRFDYPFNFKLNGLSCCPPTLSPITTGVLINARAQAKEED